MSKTSGSDIQKTREDTARIDISCSITREITQPVGAMSNSASTMVRHVQQASAQSQGINFSRRDFENNSKRTTFSSDTYEQFDYKFIAYYVDIRLLFLSYMLITSSSAKVIAVTPDHHVTLGRS